ncbi:hypothetical protein VTL71DRAFT_10139 [Oculimacula yallundae]|uniref:Extracellular serine-rich protein n=1 Tax=Oculimacula yallundae TaxID=86028 RepID=A0ABR4BPP7_9HELO
MKFASHITLLSLTTAALAETIDVKVGNGGLTFDPDSFTANVGDTVRFQFYSGFGSHSVALSSFDTPCQPASGGFYSGILQGNQAGDHTFSIDITSTDPSWIYCSVGSHCQSGMVAVINPPSSSDQNIAAYKSAAQNVLRQTPPGSVQGGILATGGESSAAAPSTTAGGLTPASPRPSLTASSGESQTVPSSVTVTTGGSSTGPASTTMGGSMSSSAAGGAGTTTPSSGSGAPASTSPSVAATSTSGGRKSEWSIVLGLAVVLGGLVALMA